MSLDEIKSAVEQLSPRERAELNAWLQNWADDDWDRQMAQDVEPGGKLDKLKQKAQGEAKAGRLKDFPKSAKS
jgi:hypothetical protein